MQEKPDGCSCFNCFLFSSLGKTLSLLLCCGKGREVSPNDIPRFRYCYFKQLNASTFLVLEGKHSLCNADSNWKGVGLRKGDMSTS